MRSENLTIENIINTPKENIGNLQDYTCKIAIARMREKGFIPIVYDGFPRLIMDVSCINCGKILKASSGMAQLKHSVYCQREVFYSC
jgi:hypothetical protein